MDIRDRPNTDEALRSVFARITRRWVRIGIIAAVCPCLALPLARWTLRDVAISQIARLANSNVQTKSVSVGLDGSVLIERLVVKPSAEQSEDYAILEAGTVYGHFNLGSFFLLRPRLEEVRISDFVLDTRYDLDTGRWNISDFGMRAPAARGKMPSIRLEKGRIEYSRVSRGRVSGVAVVPVEAEFALAEEGREGCNFTITTADASSRLNKSCLTGCWKPGVVTFAGGFSSADITAFERVWAVYTVAAELNYDEDSNYSLHLVIKDLQNKNKAAGGATVASEPEFLKRMGFFPALQRFFSRYDPQGQADIDLKASGNLKRLSESSLSGTLHCRDVSICNRGFPYAIKHIVGPIEFTEKSVELENLSGRHGEVEVTFDGWSRALGDRREYDILIRSKNMLLDAALYTALNPKQKHWWSLVSPSGLAAIDYHTTRKPGADGETTLAVELLDAAASYTQFPYPLKNLEGRLFFDRHGVRLSNVISRSDDCRINIDGAVRACNSDKPLFDLTIKGQNVSLDETLGPCLPEKQRRLYEGLNISGRADAEVKVRTPVNESSPADIEAEIQLTQTSLRPNYLPFETTNASGRILITSGFIDIENLRGSCGSGAVSAAGRIWPDAETDGLGYDLTLRGDQMQLDGELFNALPKSLATIVSWLKPAGKINYVAGLNKDAGVDRPALNLNVDCLGNSLSLEPFPYPLQNVTGSLTIAAGQIGNESNETAGDVGTARGKEAMRITGRLAQGDQESGAAHFNLVLDDVRVFAGDKGRKSIDLSATATFSDCDLKPSTGITELDAVLKMKAVYETDGGFGSGRFVLNADRLRIKGNSLTAMRADIDYDRERRCWVTKDLTADCCGGRVAGKVEFKPQKDRAPEYLLQVSFDDIDLKELVSDRAKGSRKSGQAADGGLLEPQWQLAGVLDGTADGRKATGHTTGKMAGSVSIVGQMDAPYSGTGRCRLIISDMEVGRMSPLGKVMCVLKLTEPTDFAFDKVLVDSYINRDGVLFEHLDLSGKSLAFAGSGRMDLENEDLDLVLFARGERLAAAQPTIFQSLTEGFGHAFVQLEVRGSLYDPKVTTTTLPVIKETLGILGTRRATPHP